MNDEIKELEQENGNLRKELDEANENIDMLLREIRDLKDELKELEAEYDRGFNAGFIAGVRKADEWRKNEKNGNTYETNI